MPGHFEPKDRDSVELSSSEGDDVSSCAPPRQAFGDFEAEFPTANGQSDDPTVYHTQVFIIPEGTYAMDTMPLWW